MCFLWNLQYPHSWKILLIYCFLWNINFIGSHKVFLFRASKGAVRSPLSKSESHFCKIRSLSMTSISCYCYIIDLIVHFSSHYPSVHIFIVYVSFYFLQSKFNIICYISIVFIIHIYHIWLHSYYNVIKPYCQFHLSASHVYGNQRPTSVLDNVLILDRYSMLDAELWWFYYSLSIYIKQDNNMMPEETCQLVQRTTFIC